MSAGHYCISYAELFLFEVEAKILGGIRTRARGPFESNFTDVERALNGFIAFKKVLDGEELKARIAASILRSIEARFGCFLLHWFSGFFKGDVDADLGLLALENSDEIADLGDTDVMATFDGEDDLFGVAGAVVVEEKPSIDASVRALLHLGGACSAETERPILKLVLILFGKLRGSGDVGGFADDLVGFADFETKRIVEARLDEANGEVGDIDADPAAVKLLRNLNCGATATERIEDNIAFVGRCAENAFEESFGFLGGVAEAFLGLRVDGWNVSPDITNDNARHLV